MPQNQNEMFLFVSYKKQNNILEWSANQKKQKLKESVIYPVLVSTNNQ